ncbi:MAG: efflux RND transporter periplasmic adaptor subunit [Pseudomonadota bacterium]
MNKGIVRIGRYIDFQIKLLGALSVGDVRTGTIPSLLPSQKHYLKVYSAVVCCLVLWASLLFCLGCQKGESSKTREKVINVRVQAAGVRPVRPYIETIGSLEPYEEVTVSAEVDGRLKDIRVDEGSAVAKGMILAHINDTDQKLEVKRAQAALRQAEATLANTRVEFERKKALYQQELVTRQQFDDVSTRLSLAEADLERAGVALSLSAERLRKTEVNSPLAGLIKKKNVSSGDYVKSGGNLFVIIQNNPLKLHFTLAERDAARVGKGQEVSLKVDSYAQTAFSGRVTLIYPSLDEKTRTLQVEAEVPNPRGSLKPGYFAHVTLYTGSTADAILAPVTSLLYEEEKVKVFVVEQGRAKERAIRAGSKYGEMIEVTDGLKAGEQVVVLGQQNLSNGVRVNIIR